MGKSNSKFFKITFKKLKYENIARCLSGGVSPKKKFEKVLEI